MEKAFCRRHASATHGAGTILGLALRKRVSEVFYPLADQPNNRTVHWQVLNSFIKLPPYILDWAIFSYDRYSRLAKEQSLVSKLYDLAEKVVNAYEIPSFEQDTSFKNIGSFEEGSELADTIAAERRPVEPATAGISLKAKAFQQFLAGRYDLNVGVKSPAIHRRGLFNYVLPLLELQPAQCVDPRATEARP